MLNTSDVSYPVYFQNYIDQVPERELMLAFENQQSVVNSYFDEISEEKSMHAYAPGKWTIKEMLQHLIDTERIFNYRALAVARTEKAVLPGFDENHYALHSGANSRTWKSLCNELKIVREGTLFLYKSFDEEMQERSGNVSSYTIMVRPLGFITIGHVYHHKKILETRYI
jgi:hypothetical protein